VAVWTPPPGVGTPAPWDGQPEATPEPEPTWAWAAYGWPARVTVEQTYDNPATVGPDGTVFLDYLPPLDQTGHARKGWLQLPDKSYSAPDAFGSDGTAFIAVDDTEDNLGNPVTRVYAFGTNGKLRAGWPVDVEDYSEIIPGPSGSLYVLEGQNSDELTVKVLSSAGKRTGSWSHSLPGTQCGEALRPDGTLFIASAPTATASDCSIWVYGPTGQLLSRAPVRGWDGIRMASNGTVVAWGYDLQPYSSSTIAQTRVAVIGTDGLPVSGWPVTFEGEVSAPAFGDDGTIYLTQLGIGTAPSKVLALDSSGAVKLGWPAALPVGYGPMVMDHPLPPVPGDNGVVYVAAVDRNWLGYITAFDASGGVVPGWPYQLPQAFADFNEGGDDGAGIVYGPGAGSAKPAIVIPGAGFSNPGPMFVRPPSGAGLLYLALDDRIVALDAGGQVAPGWPYLLTGQIANGTWVDMDAAPDGGLVAVAYTNRSTGDEWGTTITEWLVFRWLPGGAMPR
jgi:hypothetical protein